MFLLIRAIPGEQIQLKMRFDERIRSRFKSVFSSEVSFRGSGGNYWQQVVRSLTTLL
jgi:hypothetical protein